MKTLKISFIGAIAIGIALFTLSFKAVDALTNDTQTNYVWYLKSTSGVWSQTPVPGAPTPNPPLSANCGGGDEFCAKGFLPGNPPEGEIDDNTSAAQNRYRD